MRISPSASTAIEYTSDVHLPSTTRGAADGHASGVTRTPSGASHSTRSGSPTSPGSGA